MTTRKASDPEGESEPPGASKRPRIHENPPFLDCLNNECLLQILSYLPAEDLNSMAICSGRYRQARAHESLDQTRSGTIILRMGLATYESIAKAIVDNNWDQASQGNRRHLKVEGVQRLQRTWTMSQQVSHGTPLSGEAKLSSVTSLDLTSTGLYNGDSLD